MGRGGMAAEDMSLTAGAAASRRATWKHGETHAARVEQLGFIEVHPRSVSFKVGRATPAQPAPPRALVSAWLAIIAAQPLHL